MLCEINKVEVLRQTSSNEFDVGSFLFDVWVLCANHMCS